ncbi:hypothetical protein [Roseibium algae]|uniref:Uncharacterized protein n=1 Tax=Roseibium algae TaxID=3123038 RepID=A0ABU8TKU1_9HYPH
MASLKINGTTVVDGNRNLQNLASSSAGSSTNTQSGSGKFFQWSSSVNLRVDGNGKLAMTFAQTRYNCDVENRTGDSDSSVYRSGNCTFSS